MIFLREGTSISSSLAAFEGLQFRARSIALLTRLTQMSMLRVSKNSSSVIFRDLGESYAIGGGAVVVISAIYGDSLSPPAGTGDPRRFRGQESIVEHFVRISILGILRREHIVGSIVNC